MKVAIVYDRVNKWGGAERVLLTLHEMFPDAPLYCGVYHPGKALWAKVFPEVIPSFLNKVQFFRDKHQYLSLIMPFAFESFDFSEFDLVISVTSEFAKAIITRPSTVHICYCLTPTRYLWSGYSDYFKGRVLQAITKPLISYLRFYDRITAQRPDKIIAISTEVQDRIKRYYGRESDIVFPPVDIEKFRVSKVSSKKFYLAVGRLVPYKKFDLLVETFNQLGRKLMIIGTGNEENKLKRLANKNINFVKEISDGELTNYYRNAKALIFPQVEDFGLVPIEAQACGTPVIAFKGGGALDTVVDGVTGIFFTKQTSESLIEAIEKFDTMVFSSKKCIENSKKFSSAIFRDKLNKLING